MKGLPKGAELNAVGVKLNNNNLTTLEVGLRNRL